jgi:monoamine oxidase
MARLASSVDVAVIGAGAAGLGAGQYLSDQDLSFAILEASHRIGGRGYTEEIAPGVHFDLGCHWLHSASLNPFVAMADRAGFTYLKGTFGRTLRLGDRWANEADDGDRDAFFARSYQRIREAAAAGRDVSVAEATERDNRWTPLFDYWISLMCSTDSDQVSMVDLTSYRDTGEDWPLKEGYGNLIARLGTGLPIELNAAVTRIDRSGRDIRLTTAKGEVSAKSVILTVSTGILGAGDVRFVPDLPDWKQEAIAALPLGNHNRICLVFDRNVFGEDHPGRIAVLAPDSEPMSFGIRPFGHNYACGLTGGRFADWLERAGIEASADLAKEKLKQAFGSNITKHVVRHSVTAWRGEPWVKGAYAASVPGEAHQRAALAKPIDNRLFFAGEATAREFIATAHGAYLSGISAAEEAAAASRVSA